MKTYQQKNQKPLDNKSTEIFKFSNISEEEWIAVLDTIFICNYVNYISITYDEFYH